MKAFKAEQVINGSWGEVWIDNDYLAQVIALKAEVNPKKTAITMVQNFKRDRK